MPDNGLTIAPAQDIEFDDYTSLHRLLVTEFAYMDKRIDPPSSMHRLSPEGLSEKADKEWLILALQARELVGCVFARPEDGAVYIGKLAVRGDTRGQGVGARLLERAEEIAIESDYKTLELEVRVELTENHRFFMKHGFVKIGENAHEGFSRSTSFLFSKQISAS